jgi:2-isopropylmalate synthase
VAHGSGGVDAGITAVRKITGSEARLVSFNLVAITGGSDALSEVSAEVTETVNGEEFRVFGNGIHIDITVAGILCYVDALNKLEYRKNLAGMKSQVKNIAL